MQDIERRFGVVVAGVLRGPSTIQRDASHRTISEMFALWRARTHFAYQPLADQRLAGVAPERVVSPDAMDQLEHYGVIVPDSAGFIAGRMLAGPTLQRMLDAHLHALGDMRWGVVRAEEGEFVLPDTFGGNLVLPIAPTYCFVANNPDGVIGIEVVGQLNVLAQKCAKRFLVARHLAACPALELDGRPQLNVRKADPA